MECDDNLNGIKYFLVTITLGKNIYRILIKYKKKTIETFVIIVKIK